MYNYYYYYYKQKKIRVLTFAPPLREGLMVEEALAMVHRHKTQFYTPADTEPGELILGYIQRHRGEYITSFHFHREEDDVFLMAASCNSDCSSDFIFHTLRNAYELHSIDMIPTNKDSATYLGRMNQEKLGTQFIVHDYRVADTGIKNRSIHELGAVIYERNILGRQPNTMNVLLPRFNESDSMHAQWASIIDRYHKQNEEKKIGQVGGIKIPFTKVEEELNTNEFSDNIGYRGVEIDDAAELIRLVNKKPVWCNDLKAWTLNFNKRVQIASKKNFMLCVDPEKENQVEEFGENTTLLRFGKIEKHRFSLDYGFPYSPMTAMGVALSSFAKKLIVT